MSAANTYQAYYTKSEPILSYMTTMLQFQPEDSILEPCGGDGVFVDKILENNPQANISVFELNPASAEGLRSKYANKNNIHVKETDTLLDEHIVANYYKFDKIIGNPPYGARNDAKKKNALNRIYSDFYTKESYTLFLYACINCLKERGSLCFIVPDTFLSLHRHQKFRHYLLTHTIIKELALFPSSFFPGVNFGYANLCIITLERSNNIEENMSNSITIRTGFTSVNDLVLKDAGSKRCIRQKSVYDSVGSAFMFNASDRFSELINNELIPKIGDIADCVTGFYSGNDKNYLHPISVEVKNASKYVIAATNRICRTKLSPQETKQGISGERFLVPIVKGGNTRYIKPDEWFMDWSDVAVLEYRRSKKCRFQNSTFYFKNGLAIPMIRSGRLTAALIAERLFDQSIVGVFPHDETLVDYLLAFFNSSTCTKLINAINPSTNNSANYIKKIPFVVPPKEIINEVDAIITTIKKRIKSDNHDVQAFEDKLDAIFESLYSTISIEKIKNSKPHYTQLNLFEVV